MAQHDPDRPSVDRRSFIRTLGEQALLSVGSALALGHEVREEVIAQLREESPAASSATGPDVPSPNPGRGTANAPAAWEPLGPWAREPVVATRLLADGTMTAVDQRGLPGPRHEVPLRSVGDVVGAMRAGIIDGGLALGQAGVQALAMAAIAAGAAPRPATMATLRGAARALAGARADVPLLRAVVEAALSDAAGAAGEPVAARLSRTAVGQAAATHGEHVELARQGAVWLDGSFEGHVRVLLAGEFGPAATGSIGTTSAILRAAADHGTVMEAWIPAGMPAGRGQAILSAALAGSPATIHALADVRIGRLLLERRVQVVLLGASWVAADGSLAGEVGSRAIALLAREAEIPVIGVASSSMVVRPWPPGEPVAFDERDDGAIPLELVEGRLLSGFIGESGLRPDA